MKKFLTYISLIDIKKKILRFFIISLILVIGISILVGITLYSQVSKVVKWHETNNTTEVSSQNELVSDSESQKELNKKDTGLFNSLQFTEMTKGATILLFAIIVLFGLLAITYWIIVVVWLHKAAKLASMNGVIWPVLGMFGNLVTVALFMLFRSLKPACPNCGKRQKRALFCGYCGSLMDNECSYTELP